MPKCEGLILPESLCPLRPCLVRRAKSGNHHSKEHLVGIGGLRVAHGGSVTSKGYPVVSRNSITTECADFLEAQEPGG